MNYRTDRGNGRGRGLFGLPLGQSLTWGGVSGVYLVWGITPVYLVWGNS